MRIGLVCHSTLGGSGVIATELGHALAQRGHDIHFFCADKPPRLRSGTLHLVKTPTHELFPGGEYALALASKLAELAPKLDLVHVHYAIPHATSAALALDMTGLKFVTTLHGTDVLTLGRDPALKAVTTYALKRSAALTVPTRYLADEVKTTFGLNAEVIGNFVDTARFTPGKPTPTLVHASNFRPLKRVDDVVRIFVEVLKRVPNAQLVLVGDGPMRAQLEAQAKGLNVRFTGEADVLPLLQASRVFLFPSQTESFGLAALEALACGVPVVASSTGGLPELLTDGREGFLRPVGDILAMADAAVALLTNDSMWTRMSKAARAHAEERWQSGPRVDLYEALYRRLL